MTTKPVLQKILKGIIYTEKDYKCSQENTKNNKYQWIRKSSNWGLRKKQHKKSKMIGNTIDLSIITLNANGLNPTVAE
jgi:hypothetical protein